MPLIRKGEDFAFGSKGVVATGVTVVTAFEAGREFETNVQAKDAEGIVASHLYGNEKNSASAEGYVSLADDEDVTDLAIPALTGTIAVGDIEVPIMRTSVQGANDDFMKVRVEGDGYAAIEYGTPVEGGGGG